MGEKLFGVNQIPFAVDWRSIREGNTRFQKTVLLEAPDYTVIEGFGSKILIIPKMLGDPVRILPRYSTEPTYPNRDGHNKSAIDPTIIYQASGRDNT